MAYALDGKLGVDFASTSTTQGYPLGTRAEGSDGAKYVYVKASAACAAYAACKLDDPLTIAELTTAISGSEPTKVVVPQLAIAANSYGWAIEEGPLTVLAAANCLADAVLYTTATAGVVDDAVTDLISNLKLNSAVGGSQAATAAFASGPMSTNG